MGWMVGDKNAGRTSVFSLQRVQTGSGAHPASYPVGTRSSFSGSKAAGAECVDLYLRSLNTPSWPAAHLKHRDKFIFTSYS